MNSCISRQGSIITYSGKLPCPGLSVVCRALRTEYAKKQGKQSIHELYTSLS